MQRLLTRGALVLAVAVAAVGLTACSKYGLTGHIDGSFDSVDGTTIEGWANAADPKFEFDEDAWKTVVFVDSKPVPVVDNEWVDRPDVVEAVGKNSWGFEATVEDLPFGDHEICVDIVPTADVAKATAESNIECTELFIPEHKPLAHFDIAEVDDLDGTVDLAGWVYNSPYQPDGPWIPVLIIDDEPTIGLEVGVRTDVSDFLQEPADTVSGLDIVDEPFDPGTYDVCLGLVSDADPEDFAKLECVKIEVPT